MRDTGLEPHTQRLWIESKAALGAAQRLGPGRMRRLSGRDLLMQELVPNGELILAYSKGISNPADVLAEHLKAEIFLKNLATYGLLDD